MNTASVIIIIAVVFWLLTAIAIIDVLTKDFGSLKNKAIWFIVAFIPVIGWLLYFILGFRKGVRKTFKD